MPDFSIQMIDELHTLFIRLETLTYLQTLVSAETPDYFSPPGGMKHGKENAPDFLLDLQIKTIADLRTLLFSKPFLQADFQDPVT